MNLRRLLYIITVGLLFPMISSGFTLNDEFNTIMFNPTPDNITEQRQCILEFIYSRCNQKVMSNLRQQLHAFDTNGYFLEQELDDALASICALRNDITQIYRTHLYDDVYYYVMAVLYRLAKFYHRIKMLPTIHSRQTIPFLNSLQKD
jgi:hypothetical protein